MPIINLFWVAGNSRGGVGGSGAQVARMVWVGVLWELLDAVLD